MTIKTWQEKAGEAKELLGKVQAIVANPEASQEEKNKVDQMIVDAKQLKADAEQLKSIGELAVDLDVVNNEALRIGSKGGGAQSDGEDRPDNGGFKSFKEFLVATRDAYYGRNQGIKADPRLKYFSDVSEKSTKAGRSDQKAMSEITGAGGGFLVYAEQYGQLMAVAAPMTVVRSRATVIQMGSRQILMPILNQQQGAAGVPAWFGGMLAYWEAEEATVTETTPKFEQAEMTAHKLIVYTEVTEELLADANALTSYLSGPLGMPGAIAWKEDYGFLRGTGVGQPQGVIGAPGAVVVERAGADAIVYADLVNLFQAWHGENPVWVATRGAISQLMLMEGPAGQPAFLWGNATTGMPPTLLGFPIQFVDKLPAVGTQGDIGLYDFRYYMIGDRQATSIEFTNTFKFQQFKTSFRASHRVDGQPWLRGPITLADGVTTVSPFAVLGDPSGG
jgi:HK97 family phage major capsid protein